MDSRRRFIGSVATGIAGTLAPSSVLGANERIRIGVIGAGDRGLELVRDAAACPNTEVTAAADIYTRRLDYVRQVVPQATAHEDYRRLLEDPSVDAVLIATPHHLHAEHFIAALDAGKHVYIEKTMAFSVDHAKRMRAAWQKSAGKRAVQVGHQSCSSGLMTDAAAMLREQKMGRITAIESHMYRNTPHGKPQWTRPVFSDMTPETIQWKAFLGDAAAPREFDANRFVNWRLFWDYSGGNVYENMCHQLAFWYKALDLQIPKSATMSGGVYLWKDGREAPDTMNVSMEHPEEILFSWLSGFGNNHLGTSECVMGTDGALVKTQQIRYLPQKVNQPKAQEVLGRSLTPPRAHMQNFLDVIRGGGEINCPFEIGYRVSIACRMAVESYRRGKTAYWDAAREEIIV